MVITHLKYCFVRSQNRFRHAQYCSKWLKNRFRQSHCRSNRFKNRFRWLNYRKRSVSFSTRSRINQFSWRLKRICVIPSRFDSNNSPFMLFKLGFSCALMRF